MWRKREKGGVNVCQHASLSLRADQKLKTNEDFSSYCELLQWSFGATIHQVVLIFPLDLGAHRWNITSKMVQHV